MESTVEKPIKIEGVTDAIILEYAHQWNGGDGMKPHGVALCYVPSSYHHFVTWRIYRDPDGLWYAEMGHYLGNLWDAIDDFKERL